MRELEWKSPVDIPDGNHNGEIVKVTYRDDPYEYTDCWIKVDGAGDVEIKYGCPTTLSPNSKLGRLLILFGAEFKAGAKVNPETYLLNKRVKFMTLKKKSKDGKDFSEIVEDSLKPEIEVIKK